MNYKPVVTGNQSNGSAGKARLETVPDKDYILLPIWTQDLLFFSSSKDSPGAGYKPSGEEIEEEVYVYQPPGFEDLEFPDRVYKVEKVLYGLHQDPRACTPMETSKPLLKDENAKDVDVHLYRSMIGSLMYLTSLRHDIMFAVCTCARFQVTPKVSHLHVVKRIFKYLKGQSKLGLWYPKDSPFNLESYTDSDYQTVVANSTTKAEYVAESNCCGQVKENLKKDKIRTKPDKNRKRGKARKSQKQL
nr:hypothetical protein [Tanacetum cinerariifolium]